MLPSTAAFSRWFDPIKSWCSAFSATTPTVPDADQVVEATPTETDTKSSVFPFSLPSINMFSKPLTENEKAQETLRLLREDSMKKLAIKRNELNEKYQKAKSELNKLSFLQSTNLKESIENYSKMVDVAIGIGKVLDHEAMPDSAEAKQKVALDLNRSKSAINSQINSLNRSKSVSADLEIMSNLVTEVNKKIDALGVVELKTFKLTEILIQTTEQTDSKNEEKKPRSVWFNRFLFGLAISGGICLLIGLFLWVTQYTFLGGIISIAFGSIAVISYSILISTSS
jgi:hypothetical protein